MEYTHIFNSDFLVATMLSVMSPIELYHFRYISKYIYNHISINLIYDKIVKEVNQRLIKELGIHYNKFMDIIASRNICLYGPIINEAIWGERHHTYIDIKMIDEHMGYYTNNIFKDLKTIYPTINADLFNQFYDWFLYESDKSVIINNVRLYIISRDCKSKNFSDLFQNEITGKLMIKDIKAVMYKIDQSSNYYNYSWFHHDKDEAPEELCKKYKLIKIS